MDLQRLANRLGYLSPELALGWKLGEYLEQYFDGLEVTRIAARAHSETILSLTTMLGWQQGDSVVVVGAGEPPWSFDCYHPLTGTVLRVRPVVEETTLSPDIIALEERLSHDPKALRDYSSAVDGLIGRLLDEPLTTYCAVDEHRCRRAARSDTSKGIAPRRCRRCGAVYREPMEFWYSEGVLCCSRCAGLHAQWFDRQ